MTEEEARAIVDSWTDVDEDDYDIEGCVEDLMDGRNDKEDILTRNEYLD